VGREVRCSLFEKKNIHAFNVIGNLTGILKSRPEFQTRSDNFAGYYSTTKITQYLTETLNYSGYDHTDFHIIASNNWD
jgi:hypothetical protein